MKKYSIAKFENIVKNDIPTLLAEIRSKMSKHCPNLHPYAFVKDRMVVIDTNDNKQYMCKYQLSENSIQLTGVERIEIAKTYLRDALTEMFTKIKKGVHPAGFTVNRIVAAANRQASFKNIVESLFVNSYKLAKSRSVANPIREAFKKKFEEADELQKMAIKSAARTKRPVYALQEGQDVTISFTAAPRKDFTKKFTWVARRARRSLTDSILQEKLVTSMLNAKKNGTEIDPIMIESYADNVTDGWMVTRTDVTKAFKKLASKHSIVVSTESIKECSAKIYNAIVERFKAPIARMVECVYGGTSKLIDQDVSNAIAVARKYVLLKEQNEESQLTPQDATSSLEGASQDVVDKDVEAATDEESTEDYHYKLSDVDEYIKMLKDVLKDRYPEKYAANYSDEGEKTEVPGAPEAPAQDAAPEENDFFEEDVKKTAGIVNEMEDAGASEDEIQVVEDEKDISMDDQTDEVLGEEDEDEVEDEAAEIISMVEDLEKMKDAGQVDGERVSEIAGWVYDEIESAETEDKEEKDKEGDSDDQPYGKKEDESSDDEKNESVKKGETVTEASMHIPGEDEQTKCPECNGTGIETSPAGEEFECELCQGTGTAEGPSEVPGGEDIETDDELAGDVQDMGNGVDGEITGDEPGLESKFKVDDEVMDSNKHEWYSVVDVLPDYDDGKTLYIVADQEGKEHSFLEDELESYN